METIPFTEAKTRLSELFDLVEREHTRLTVTRNGRPAAVLISPDDLDSLEETLEILSDRELADSLRRSRREAASGMAEPLERPK